LGTSILTVSKALYLNSALQEDAKWQVIHDNQ
jgi:hypothetical protein